MCIQSNIIGLHRVQISYDENKLRMICLWGIHGSWNNICRIISSGVLHFFTCFKDPSAKWSCTESLLQRVWIEYANVSDDFIQFQRYAKISRENIQNAFKNIFEISLDKLSDTVRVCGLSTRMCTPIGEQFVWHYDVECLPNRALLCLTKWAVKINFIARPRANISAHMTRINQK